MASQRPNTRSMSARKSRTRQPSNITGAGRVRKVTTTRPTLAAPRGQHKWNTMKRRFLHLVMTELNLSRPDTVTLIHALFPDMLANGYNAGWKHLFDIWKGQFREEHSNDWMTIARPFQAAGFVKKQPNLTPYSQAELNEFSRIRGIVHTAVATNGMQLALKTGPDSQKLGGPHLANAQPAQHGTNSLQAPAAMAPAAPTVSAQPRRTVTTKCRAAAVTPALREGSKRTKFVGSYADDGDTEMDDGSDDGFGEDGSEEEDEENEVENGDNSGNEYGSDDGMEEANPTAATNDPLSQQHLTAGEGETQPYEEEHYEFDFSSDSDDEPIIAATPQIATLDTALSSNDHASGGLARYIVQRPARGLTDLRDSDDDEPLPSLPAFDNSFTIDEDWVAPGSSSSDWF